MPLSEYKFGRKKRERLHTATQQKTMKGGIQTWVLLTQEAPSPSGNLLETQLLCLGHGVRGPRLLVWRVTCPLPSDTPVLPGRALTLKQWCIDIL